MRAYSDVYLGDVVENQGKLFDYVANTYPDKDTEDFINAYMTSLCILSMVLQYTKCGSESEN